MIRLTESGPDNCRIQVGTESRITVTLSTGQANRQQPSPTMVLRAAMPEESSATGIQVI